MSKGDLTAVLIAFAAYLLLMIVIGIIYMKQTNDSEDYFLGGRGLGGWVAALSAQASDMSGWLLMGLPGAIYAMGTGQAWIAIGLFLGTVFNWVCISSRLRRYTIKANNSLTLPAYFENRFRDKKKILLLISSIVIVIFFLVYTASALAAGGKLFNSVFGLDYHIALAIGAGVILVYTFMGGFMAVCVTDFVQGTMMLIGLMVVPIVAFFILGGGDGVVEVIDQSGVAGGASSYLNLFTNGERPYTFVEIFSQLAWGLGYCGMPHILTRFMAVKNQKELRKSRVIAIIWVMISLGCACLLGILGRAFLFPTILGTEGTASTENVFIEMIIKMFTETYSLPFIGGLFLCGILAAIMSTADSQLLVTASAVSKDLYKDVFRPNTDEKKVLSVSRWTVAVVAILAFIIAWDPDNSIMGLVSNAWAGLGSAFGPIVLLSLFWRRANLAGAVAGIISGGLTVIIWDYIPLVGGQTLGTATGLYSLAVGFVISCLCIVIFSLATKAPSQEILDEFDSVKNWKED
ncbi:MAG TPA: sodium/proline symporter PutP [Candidatus Egerieimonas intestinavium]|uniref:Sodium/proline symporter n=1 Tax=Candidatus Egerieimonas intestinavium TaxID=2840777 RepID=A0A9D1ELL5_9FIRM|nr:sodium/proline symporter PutP [Candidatus Egerieimonas intestinavium]